MKVCFITAFEDYREEFKESFPELEEAKYFIRKPKAIEDLVKHVATILGQDKFTLIMQSKILALIIRT